MKAVYCTAYGSIEHLKIVDIEKPICGENEILVQVAASTVQTGDWRIRTLTMPAGMGFFAKLIFGFRRPKQPILGTELSGKIVTVGSKVSGFTVNDDVIAATGAKFGAHAEFVKISDTGVIVKKPAKLSFQQAATLPFGGVTALDFLKYRAKIKSGERVLINGASGAVGIAAVQIAKMLGAHVTAVCSESNGDFVQQLGADLVVDYAKENFWQQSDTYNVIFDVTDNVGTAQLLNVLKKDGRLILISAGMGQMLGSVFRNLFSSQKILCGVANETTAMLQELVQLAEEGAFKPIIDKEFPLKDIGQAHAHVEKRHKRGNVVINFID